MSTADSPAHSEASSWSEADAPPPSPFPSPLSSPTHDATKPMTKVESETALTVLSLQTTPTLSEPQVVDQPLTERSAGPLAADQSVVSSDQLSNKIASDTENLLTMQKSKEEALAAKMKSSQFELKPINKGFFDCSDWFKFPNFAVGRDFVPDQPKRSVCIGRCYGY